MSLPDFRELWTQAEALDRGEQPAEPKGDAGGGDAEEGSGNEDGESGEPARAGGGDGDSAGGKEDKEDKPATPKEHYQLRAERRRLQAKFAEERQKLAQEQERLRPMVEAAKHAETGDWEKAIQALSGRDFKTIADEVIRRGQGQDIEAQRRIERIEKEREEERARMRQYEQQQEQARTAAAQRQWVAQNIVQPLADDESTKKLSTNNTFVSAVFQTVRNRYHETGELGDVKSAISETRERFTKIYQELGEALGIQNAESAETREGTDRTGESSVGKRVRRTRTVSNSRATGAAGSAPKELSDEEWSSMFRKEMERARREEEAGKQ